MTKPIWTGAGLILLVNSAIILLSACIGIGLNRAFVAGPQESGYSYSNEGGKQEFKPFEAKDVQPVPAKVWLQDVSKIIDSKSMIPVDGRSEIDYENGHLPGAVSLSVAAFDMRFQEFLSQYPKDGAYLIYCSSGQCGLSRQLASLLQHKGY